MDIVPVRRRVVIVPAHYPNNRISCFGNEDSIALGGSARNADTVVSEHDGIAVFFVPGGAVIGRLIYAVMRLADSVQESVLVNRYRCNARVIRSHGCR